MQTHERIDPSRNHSAVRRAQAHADTTRGGPEKQHNLVTLQRSIGNAQVSRLIAQREAKPEDDILAKHDIDRSSVDSGPEVGLDGGPISDGLSSRINSKRGGGSSLDSGTLNRMEGAFGSRFDDVRIHTDTEADSLNRSVSARAFTTGSDIFFSSQASPSDSNLLAHELTHVVQQRAAPQASGPLTVGPAGDSHESAADAAAASVASGSPAPSAQRQEDPALATIAREDAVPDEDDLRGA
jgi:hypothetical protein